TDLQNVHQAIMRAGYRFKFLDAAKLAFEGTDFFKAISIDELDRSKCSHDAFGEPNFTITAAANAAQHFVVWNRRRRIGRRIRMLAHRVAVRSGNSVVHGLNSAPAITLFFP